MAINAKIHGWHYVGGAGIPDPPGLRANMSVTEADFGCRTVVGGIPITLTEKRGGGALTNLGWIELHDLLEPAPRRDPNYGRPKLCDAHGLNCVYTDAHPYERAK